MRNARLQGHGNGLFRSKARLRRFFSETSSRPSFVSTTSSKA